LVEQLIRNQQVVGSSPTAGSKITDNRTIPSGKRRPVGRLTANLTA
jgi:hypothetical protein